MALTLTLIPGYTYQDNELDTAAKRNLAANPTVSLSGSVGTLSLADGSVTTPKLIDGVLSADATGRAKMADGFITTSKIGANQVTAACLDLNTQLGIQQYGSTATGGPAAYAITLSPAPTSYVTGMVVRFRVNTANTGGATLNVNGLGAQTIYSAGSYTTLAAGQLQPNCQYTAVYVSGGGFCLIGVRPFFITGENALSGSNGVIINTPHGLGGVPTLVRGILRCKTGENGYSAGDEIDCGTMWTSQPLPAFYITATATNLILVQTGAVSFMPRGAGSGASAGTTGGTSITTANWKLVMYAML